MRPFLLLSLAVCALGRSAAAQSSAPSPPTVPTAGASPGAPTPGAAPPGTPAPSASSTTVLPTQPALPTFAPPSMYTGQPNSAVGYPPAHPDPDARSHKGFFLRMAMGGGYVATSTQIDSPMYGGKVKAGGSAFAFELDIGAALRPGFILAGSYSVHGVSDAKLTEDTRSFRAPHDPQITLLAAMIDLYPNPKDGFHFGGGLGLATMRLRADEDIHVVGSQNGVGILPHVGYEWWVGNYWGLGVLGRFLYARTKGDYLDGKETDASVGASILFSASYN